MSKVEWKLKIKLDGQYKFSKIKYIDVSAYVPQYNVNVD